HGPKCWIVTAIVGAIVGLGISQLYVPGGDHGHALIPGPQSASGEVEPGMTHGHEDHDGHGHEAGDVDHGHDDGHGEHGIHSDEEGSGLTHPDSHHDDHHDPVVPLWLVIPFALLLGS